MRKRTIAHRCPGAMPAFYTVQDRICLIRHQLPTNCTRINATSGKSHLVNNGIFFRLMIVALASTALHESPLLIEPAGPEVRLPHFQEDPVRIFASSQVEKLPEQSCAQPSALEYCCDDDVFDFP